MFECNCGYHTCKESYESKKELDQHIAGVKAARKKNKSAGGNKMADLLDTKPWLGPYGTGLKIGVYWWDGTEKHRQFIIRMRHVAAVKAALAKGFFVENNDLTEEELSGKPIYTPD